MDTGVIVQFFKLTGRVSRDLGGSLKELGEYFGIEVHDLHTAKGDTLATIEILKKLRDLDKEIL